MAVITPEGDVKCHHPYGPDSTYTVPMGNAVAVSCGVCYTAALSADGELHYWGENVWEWDIKPQEKYIKNLGLRSGKRIVLQPQNIVSISCGNSHIAALTADGRVFCWGKNDHKQCNVPPDLGPVHSIWCKDYVTMALTAEGKLVHWGGRFKTCTIPEDLVVQTEAAELM